MSSRSRWRSIAASLLLLACCVAGKRADVVATLDPPTLPQAGGHATLDVAVTIHEGFHAQSHTPADPYAIAFAVQFADPLPPGVQVDAPQYPPGTAAFYPALGAMNVYTGTVHVRVPIAVDASANATAIAGSVRLQECDDRACYPPERLPFTVPIRDNTIATTPPSTQPATSPSAGMAIAPPSAPTFFGAQLTHDAYALAFGGAFVVGLLFNLMPCVLPVVPLKILGFYEASRHDRGRSIVLGLVFSAGLVASFAVLAILVIGLRVIDWGGLFRQTWFTVALVAILLVMALNLLGLFAIALPAGAYRFAPRHDTLTGNFLFGILTAALSTPCTFGLFVALLAWALAEPPAVGVALLMTVGIGMAFPYAALSAAPELAARFPRTGALGEIVRQGMGFALTAVAIYFAWPLLARVASPAAIWWLIFAVIAAGLLFVALRTTQLAKRRWPKLATTIAAAVLLVPTALATHRLASQPFQWTPYSDEALAAARAARRSVLIDFTATWCGNCHYIEGTVLHDPRVVQQIASDNILMLQADVTDNNAPGQPLLSQLSPAGAIPVTAIYLHGAGSPTVLTGIYTAPDLLKILTPTNAR